MIFFVLDKLLLVKNMRDLKYEKIANSHKAPEKKFRNAFVAFLSGGFLGFLAEGIIEILMWKFELSRMTSATYMIVFFIFFASLFTALGFFDWWVTKFKCGLIIPITGFAHSMTSSSLDYRTEGPIYGIGSNMFKLAGSVILYGVLSAWFFGTIRYLIGVIG